MSFSQEWDQRYKENKYIGSWPWSDLISFVMRYSQPTSQTFRTLELGCGSGANIPFFLKLGVEYYAIEGSPTIVEKLGERFPELKKNIVVGDFTKLIPFSGNFDLIIDRGSLTCNTTSAIKNCLKLVYSQLKAEGKFIGIDWFSTLHSDYARGESEEDEHTRRNFIDGHLAKTGRVHFSDKKHLEEIFSDFKIEIMEHKIVRREIPIDNFIFASFNLVAKKI